MASGELRLRGWTGHRWFVRLGVQQPTAFRLYGQQLHDLNPDVDEHLQELCLEKRIAIIDQIPPPNKQTIDGIAVVPADLAHPPGRTAPRSAAVRDESILPQSVKLPPRSPPRIATVKKVRRDQQFPVAAQELLPSGLTVPLPGRPATTEMDLGFLASVQLSIMISQPRSYVFKQIQFLDTTLLLGSKTMTSR